METVRSLEVTVASWYKNVPHLPKSGQKWLAENIWWLTLVGVILGALGIISTLFVTMLAGVALVGFGGVVGAAVGGLALIAVLVTLAFAVIDVLIGATAIMPLKSMQQKGWSLLFLMALVNTASLVVSFLFHFELFGLIWGLLWIAVGLYFLYEIHDYFVAVKSHRHAKTAKVSKVHEG
ncbi:MAG TPA: hypothetical protein VLG36_01015 [Candidatus Chromulinivoraceae bacterium]|nr:hypothetical protein [Candidatus Chromulinivoraceae bacterium]